MAADILRLKFEAEQKRSRQIEQKLNDMVPERIPDTKKAVAPTVVPAEAEKQELVPKQEPAEPEFKAVKTAAHVRSTMTSGKMSLKDAVIMSEIISKPVSKRR